jgi:uncharacterized protein
MKYDSITGQELISLAKDSINSYFQDIDFKVDQKIKDKFSKKQGVFVTLTINNTLRGCIGFVESVYPLYKAIIDAAKSAAFSDPRFNPLTKLEFSKIKIEISVLTIPSLIEVKGFSEYVDHITIGEDGLIIKSNYGSGLLLPQVFTEYKCNVTKALEMTCEKAMLPHDAWKDLDNKIYKFQAHIFKE